MPRFELIANRIDELHEEIESYHHNLNMEAVFLFLASLGCYGISNDYLKIAALFITFLLFVSNLILSAFNNPKFPNSKYHPWNRSFLKNINYLEMIIEAAYSKSDSEYVRLENKLNSCKALLSTKKLIFGKNIRFFFCFIFYWCVVFDISRTVFGKN